MTQKQDVTQPEERGLDLLARRSKNEKPACRYLPAREQRSRHRHPTAGDREENGSACAGNAVRKKTETRTRILLYKEIFDLIFQLRLFPIALYQSWVILAPDASEVFPGVLA